MAIVHIEVNSLMPSGRTLLAGTAVEYRGHVSDQAVTVQHDGEETVVEPGIIREFKTWPRPEDLIPVSPKFGLFSTRDQQRFYLLYRLHGRPYVHCHAAAAAATGFETLRGMALALAMHADVLGVVWSNPYAFRDYHKMPLSADLDPGDLRNAWTKTWIAHLNRLPRGDLDLDMQRYRAGEAQPAVPRDLLPGEQPGSPR